MTEEAFRNRVTKTGGEDMALPLIALAIAILAGRAGW